uniref:hypothetical protein n=1 Tax=Ndongobacter massiliensis TaxID=1871025 RepID=UPI000AB6E71A|nr:hypothetical protein [Ndongobacter massiliensis]
MPEMEDVKNLFLAKDVERIVVETDEENPVPIATFDRSETPTKLADGYRVRVKFTED